MKILRLLALSSVILGAAISANAQKNTWIVELDGTFDHQSYDPQYPYPTQTLNNWSLDLAVGKQISNHITVGGMVGYAQAQTMSFRQVMPIPPLSGGPYWEAVKYDGSNLKLGVWGRYTYWLDKRFYLYSQLSIDYLTKESHQQSGVYAYYSPIVSPPYSPSEELLLGTVSANLFPAIGMNIIKGYGVHMDIGGISYTHSEINITNGQYNRININFGHQFSFGLQKIIGRGKTEKKEVK